MTRDQFWDHIRASRRRDPEEHAERLAARLGKLAPDAILSFARWWAAYHAKAYTWKLWGAAYLVNGGCSDDGFHYFRNAVLLLGRERFSAVTAAPDALAVLLDRDADVFEFDGNPAADAYLTATSQAEYDRYHEAVLAAYPNLARDADNPAGARWDFDDDAQMKRRYPRLFARCTPDD